MIPSIKMTMRRMMFMIVWMVLTMRTLLMKMFTTVVWRTTWSRRRMARVELILRKEVAWGGAGSSPTWCGHWRLRT